MKGLHPLKRKILMKELHPLKEIRLAEGLTQQNLSDILGYSQSALCLLEKGTHRPSIELLYLLMLKYNLNLNEFIDDLMTWERVNK